jgi:hypothetical protein
MIYEEPSTSDEGWNHEDPKARGIDFNESFVLVINDVSF